MADLDDLGFTSITEKSKDEALEQLRLIRLSRRTSIKPPHQTYVRKPKAEDIAVSADQAAAILKLIKGE